MVNLKCALVIACLPIIGCVQHRNAYNVQIDPAFTPSEVEEIMVGVNDWMTKIPSLTLNPIIAGCNGRQDSVICLHSSNLDDVASHAHKSNITGDNHSPVSGYTDNSDDHPEDWAEGTDGAEIWIATDFIVNPPPQYDSGGLRVIVEHEMGHAMSFVHHPGAHLMELDHNNSNTIMATCDDIAQFYQIRGMEVPSCPIL